MSTIVHTRRGWNGVKGWPAQEGGWEPANHEDSMMRHTIRETDAWIDKDMLVF